MSTRKQIIEQIRRAIYGSQPPDTSNITVGLVNIWINQGAALAAQKNYSGSSQMESISYVNSSFYTTYKGLTITPDENLIYKLLLPSIPIGIGQNEGVSTVMLKDATGLISYPLIFLNQNQRAINRGRRVIPNKLVGWQEGQYVYAISTIPLSTFTATVSMVSSGDSTNLDGIFNVPDDYMPIIIDYCVKMGMTERMQKKDLAADGIDMP